MIQRTMRNTSLKYHLFQEFNDIFKEDAKIKEFIEYINTNKQLLIELSNQRNSELTNNEVWKQANTMFDAYKGRLRRIALFECHADRKESILNSISTNEATVARAKTLMHDIGKTVIGQLDDKDTSSLLLSTTLKHYLVPPVLKARSTSSFSSSPAASQTRKSPNKECYRDGDRPCSSKAARDGRGLSKEELVQIALHDCDWGMTEAEIRRLTIPQLCARIKIRKTY